MVDIIAFPAFRDVFRPKHSEELKLLFLPEKFSEPFALLNLALPPCKFQGEKLGVVFTRRTFWQKGASSWWGPWARVWGRIHVGGGDWLKEMKEKAPRALRLSGGVGVGRGAWQVNVHVFVEHTFGQIALKVFSYET